MKRMREGPILNGKIVYAFASTIIYAMKQGFFLSFLMGLYIIYIRKRFPTPKILWNNYILVFDPF